MGLGVLTGEVGAGLYTVSRDFGTERLDVLLGVVNDRLDETFAPITALEAEHAALTAALVPYETAFADATQAYIDALSETCTPEGFEAASISAEYAALRESALALYENRDTIDEHTRKLGEVESALELLALALKGVDELVKQSQGVLNNLWGSVDGLAETVAKKTLDLTEKMAECRDAGTYYPACWADEQYELDYAIAEYNEVLLIEIPDAIDDLETHEAMRDLVQEAIDTQTALQTTYQGVLDTATDAVEGLTEDYEIAEEAYTQALADRSAFLKPCAAHAFVDELGAINDAIVQLNAKRAEIDPVYADLQLLKAEQQNLYEARDRLLGVTDDLEDESDIWCADYTEEKSAGREVATIEIPGEPDIVVLAPGCAEYDEYWDGQLLSREVLTASQAYWNAAALPGWQRWRPMFRAGTVSALDKSGDLCTVTLDSTTSTAQDLTINPEDPVLTGVPVDYMGCNAEAFENGDHVVVRFRAYAWDDPVVIGFVSNPRECPEEEPPEIKYLLLYSECGSVRCASAVVYCGDLTATIHDRNYYLSYPDGSGKQYIWRFQGSYDLDASTVTADCVSMSYSTSGGGTWWQYTCDGISYEKSDCENTWVGEYSSASFPVGSETPDHEEFDDAPPSFESGGATFDFDSFSAIGRNMYAKYTKREA